MRNYPATLVQVFENKLEEGHDTSDDSIPFRKDDLTKATDELDIDVRHVMEIPSAYSSQTLPDEIADHGYTIERDTDHEGPGEQYLFVKE